MHVQSRRQAARNRVHREGCIFNGWNTASDGTGAKYANLASIRNLTAKADGEVTLFAQWIRTSFNVILDSNGCDDTPQTMQGTYKTTVRLPKSPFAREGYTFLGWNTDPDGLGTSYKNGAGIKVITSEEDFTLYAQWASNIYAIRLYSNDLDRNEECYEGYSRTVAKALPANPFTRKGFTFTGWNTRPDGTGKKYANLARVKALCNDASGKVTLYAQWKPIDYTIKYVLNGGKNPTVGTLKKYRITTSTTALPIPTGKNVTFAGWYTTKTFAEGTEITEVPVIPENGAKTLTVYAKWN